MFSVKVCNLRPNHLDQGNRINVQILNIPLEYIMILIERIGFSRNAIKRFWLALRLSWCECLKMAEKESDKNVNATSWLVEPSLNDYSPYMNDIVQIICELFSLWKYYKIYIIILLKYNFKCKNWVFVDNGTSREKPCIRIQSSTWLNHPTNELSKSSFGYAFCKYEKIFIKNDSELVSYQDALKKCGSLGLGWPRDLKLRLSFKKKWNFQIETYRNPYSVMMCRNLRPISQFQVNFQVVVSEFRT